MSDDAKQLLRTLETDDKQIEKILGHRQKTAKIREYFVKFVGKRYGLSEWVTADDLKAHPKGQVLLSRYDNVSQAQRAAPPFYDPSFDVPDYIIAEKGGRYLVKWTNQLHEAATWESAVDQKLIDEYKARQEMLLPQRNSDVSESQTGRKAVKLAQYSLNGKGVPQRPLVALNYLLACWHRGIDAKFVDSLKFDQTWQCLAFLDYLMRYENEVGPFLCVVSSKSLNDWYEICRKDELMVPLLYAWSKLNIEVINEIDFWDSESMRLRFNVLLTTVDVLSQELDRLSSINWRVMMITDVPFQFDEESQLAKMISRLHAHFKVIFSASNWINQSQVVCAYAGVFACDAAASLVSRDTLAAYELMKRSVVCSALKPIGRVAVMSVNCPLSDFQKFMCKMVMIDHQDAIQHGDFAAVARAISRICVHPLTIFGTERKYHCPDFLASSTKMQVLDLIVKQALEHNKIVLICTEFPLLKSCLLHELGYHDLKCREWNPDVGCSDITGLYVCCKWDSQPQIPFEKFHVVVFLNCIWDYWAPMLSNLAQSSGILREVYRLECAHCKEKQLTASYRSNDEARLGEYCCNAAFHVIVDKAAPSPSHLLHDTVIVGDDEGQDDQRCSSFVDRELVGPEFWNGFFKTTSASRIKSPFLDKDRPSLNSSSEWTMHQRDRFVDGFFSFGWNRARDVMTYSGLAIDEDLYEVMCRGILRVLLASVRRHTFSYELIANFVRASEGEQDCAAEDLASISKGVFAKEKFRETLSSKAQKLMKRISVLHFLRSFAETTQVDVDDLRLSQPGPASWWTKEHDMALAIGICKYGMSHYEFFECDEDKRLRDISRYHNGQRISYAQLNKRAEEVANKALDVLMNMDTKEDLAKCISRTKPGETWNVDEIQAVLDHLAAHGIELDKEGEYDWEAVASSLKGLDRPQDQIRSFIEELLWMCEYHSKEIGVDTVNSLFMLKKRINGMYQLRMLFLGHTDTEVKEMLSKVPRWRIMSDAWTPDLEFTWLSELLLHGFGAHLPVFETEEMHQVSGSNNIPEVFKHDLHIIQRIAVIFEHAKANHLVNEHISQQTKARKIDAAAPTVSQTVPGPDTEIEYPIMITPNSFIHNIGTIEYKRPGFHSERYIYPIGFKTSRISASLDNPDERTRWYSEIIDTGENTPVFRVWMEGRPNTIFQGVTPTAPWSQALKAVASCRRNKGKVTSISGPEAFLLASPIATYLIQNLPNADKCTNYVMRNVSANPHIKRLYDKTQEPADPEPDSDERSRPPEPTPDHADPAPRRKK